MIPARPAPFMETSPPGHTAAQPPQPTHNLSSIFMLIYLVKTDDVAVDHFKAAA
jgi:hypothetical protein